MGIVKKVFKALPAVGAVGAGGVGAYDMYRGLKTYKHEDLQKLLKGKAVSLSQAKKLLKGHAKKVNVIRSVKDMEKYPSHFAGIKGRMRRGLYGAALKQGNNAFAFAGKDQDFLVLPGAVSKEVVQHEAGHLKDFAKKKIYEGKDPHYRQGSFWHGLGQAIWKPKFKREVLAREEAAWAHVPKSEKSEHLQKETAKSYNKGFHLRRGVMSLSTLPSLVALALRKGR